ncbi:MAG TPA: YhjD/YihY/BrkB family envelope integrity protein, partial [Solirubrobacteraceae bacterium]|nr:YhjD/YihY/BrkB family envelope integrity protein [Solirubrobacteraceae bacterium]
MPTVPAPDGPRGPRSALDRWQRRHLPVAFAVAVARKFGQDRASMFAALIAYYAFLSLFPLLLALVSLLGLLLQDDPELQAQVLDTALARIPVIGEELRDDVGGLEGSGIGLALGLAGALWAGLGVTVVLGRAFDAVRGVPRFRQPGTLRARARGMAALAVLALALLAATVASGLALGGAIGPVWERIATAAIAFTATGAVLLATFALLTGPPRTLRPLVPGVLVASAGSLALQAAGSWYVGYAIVDAGAVYGSFALVIGLVSWFWLGAHVLLVAAEVNAVLERRLWPRSLAGELTPADREALRVTAT